MFFVTINVHRWYPLFDRFDRWEILLQSLQFHQKERDLNIFNWVFMLNHLHLIFQNPKPYDFMRSFKSYTSHELVKDLKVTEPWVLRSFKTEKGHSIWRDKNHPMHIFSYKFYIQKARYIEYNPVKKGYVYKPEDWKYSSANKIQLLKLSSFI